MAIDTPNVILPLAASYNVRGIQGYTNTVTNAIDQRKVNSIYNAVKNSLTGNTTLYLSKRPGVDIDAASLGTTGQVAYLANLGASLGGLAITNVWLFSVSGNDVRASNSAGTTTVIETAANYKPFYVDKTSIGGSDTVVLQTGTDSSTQHVWYSTTIGTWTQVTDGDFPDVIGKMEFLDGYAFAMSDSANVQRIYNSDINSLANWTATSYVTKQIQQDRTMGLMRLGNQIIAVGQESVEIFRNAGNAVGSPLESVQQLAQRWGGLFDVSGPYYCTIGNRLYFASRHGNFRNPGISTYNGSTFDKISTPSIDRILSEGSIRTISKVNVLSHEAVAVQLTLTTASTQIWLMYFPEWNEWFEWNSTVFTPVNSGYWHLGVGANQHRMYALSSVTSNWQDDGTNYDEIHQFQLPNKGNQRQRMPFCAIKGDTSRSAHTITIAASDDDDQNFSTIASIDMTSAAKKAHRCGSWQGSRTIRITNSANLEGRMEAFLARIE